MERGPEPIPWPSEVVTGRGGVESGIDAAEEHIEVGTNQIWYGSADSGLELTRLQNFTRPVSMSRNMAKSPARLYSG